MPTNPFQHWSPELRRAIMRVAPEYFTWDPRQREIYGVALAAADRKRIEQALLQELFGRTFASEEAAAEALDDLTSTERNLWNSTILSLTGIGEDCFLLNECFPEGKTILDFPTLLSFDEDDYRFQEASRKKEDSTYTGKSYRGTLYLGWARLFIDQAFTYATLSMAAGYLYAELDGAADDLIEQRIPHRLLPGRDHGKPEGDTWVWDMRTEAGGQEALLDELKGRVFRYLRDRWEVLADAWDAAARRCVYIVDTSQPGDPGTHFVFSDKSALADIHFHSFLRDCRAIEQPATELEAQLSEEKAALAAFIDAQRDDLARNFDPKITRLRKKARVLIHKDAFGKRE